MPTGTSGISRPPNSLRQLFAAVPATQTWFGTTGDVNATLAKIFIQGRSAAGAEPLYPRPFILIGWGPHAFDWLGYVGGQLYVLFEADTPTAYSSIGQADPLGSNPTEAWNVFGDAVGFILTGAVQLSKTLSGSILLAHNSPFVVETEPQRVVYRDGDDDFFQAAYWCNFGTRAGG